MRKPDFKHSSLLTTPFTNIYLPKLPSPTQKQMPYHLLPHTQRAKDHLFSTSLAPIHTIFAFEPSLIPCSLVSTSSTADSGYTTPDPLTSLVSILPALSKQEISQLATHPKPQDRDPHSQQKTQHPHSSSRGVAMIPAARYDAVGALSVLALEIVFGAVFLYWWIKYQDRILGAVQRQRRRNRRPGTVSHGVERTDTEAATDSNHGRRPKKVPTELSSNASTSLRRALAQRFRDGIHAAWQRIKLVCRRYGIHDRVYLPTVFERPAFTSTSTKPPRCQDPLDVKDRGQVGYIPTESYQHLQQTETPSTEFRYRRPNAGEDDVRHGAVSGHVAGGLRMDVLREGESERGGFGVSGDEDAESVVRRIMEGEFSGC